MSPLCRQKDSLLLCIDIQDRLLQAMVEPARSRMIENTVRLLKTAQLLSIPVMYTEQYPQGLGSTIAEIKEVIPEDSGYFDKTSFSCCATESFIEAVRTSRKRQVIITGMETHVCVMQTALELQDNGVEVYIADDAVCSQKMAHWKSALNRLRQMQITAAPTESILFEWLRDSSHEHFKTVSGYLR
jgi:nicotinamidase-related amidase